MGGGGNGGGGGGGKTWWKDKHDANSDPKAPGCHYRYTTDQCTVRMEGAANIIGDMCAGPGNEWIVELHDQTCHFHEGAYAKPHLYKCSDVCKKATAKCEAANVAAGGGDPGCASAKCVCD